MSNIRGAREAVPSRPLHSQDWREVSVRSKARIFHVWEQAIRFSIKRLKPFFGKNLHLISQNLKKLKTLYVRLVMWRKCKAVVMLELDRTNVTSHARLNELLSCNYVRSWPCRRISLAGTIDDGRIGQLRSTASASNSQHISGDPDLLQCQMQHTSRSSFAVELRQEQGRVRNRCCKEKLATGMFCLAELPALLQQSCTPSGNDTHKCRLRSVPEHTAWRRQAISKLVLDEEAGVASDPICSNDSRPLSPYFMEMSLVAAKSACRGAIVLGFKQQAQYIGSFCGVWRVFCEYSGRKCISIGGMDLTWICSMMLLSSTWAGASSVELDVALLSYLCPGNALSVCSA